jgi:hypothetical protein
MSFTDLYPIVYLAPNHDSDNGYVPNIDSWVSVLKETDATGVICYIRPSIHRMRLYNRIENKKGTSENQHSDNYLFSYQNLFYKLDSENIKYIVIDTGGE